MSYLFARCLRRCRGPFEFCAFVCVGHETPEYMFRVGVRGEEAAAAPTTTEYCTPCDMFNYDRALYSSPEEAAAASLLYKFFLRYTRYFT